MKQLYKDEYTSTRDVPVCVRV